MADTPPSTISSLDELHLEPIQQEEFFTLIRNNPSLEDLQKFFFSLHVPINVNALIAQTNERYLLTNSQSNSRGETQETTPVNNNAARQALVAGLALAALPAYRKTATGKVTEKIQEEHEQELNRQFEEAVKRGNVEEATRLINSLDADSMLAGQVTRLKGSIPDPFREELWKEIDRKHEKTLQNDKEKEDKKGKKKQEEMTLSLKELQDSLQTKDLTDEQKKNALIEFRRIARLQRAQTQENLEKIIQDEHSPWQFWKNGRSMFDRKTRREILKRKGQSTAPTEESTPLEIPRVSVAPEEDGVFDPGEAPFDGKTMEGVGGELGGDVPVLGNLPIPGATSIAPGLGTAAAVPEVGAAAAEDSAFATFLPWIIGLVALVVFIIIIILIINNSQGGSPGPLQLTQLTCGNEPTQDQDAKGDLIANRLHKEFHIGLGGMITEQPTDATYIQIAKDAYDTICVLFGQHVGSPYIQKTYNTFGKKLVGNYGDQTGQQLAKQIVFTVQPSSKDHPDCTITPQGNPEKDVEMIWNFWAPEKCLSIYRLQFRIAHTLGLSLLYQEEYLADSRGKTTSLLGVINNVFPDFSPITIQYGKIVPLPSYGCTKAIGTQDFLPECFADMVGEYLTYPNYLDTSPGDQSTQ